MQMRKWTSSLRQNLLVLVSLDETLRSELKLFCNDRVACKKLQFRREFELANSELLNSRPGRRLGHIPLKFENKNRYAVFAVAVVSA